MAEWTDEYCFHCRREFTDIRDFPLIYIDAVSVLKPEQIPADVFFKKDKSRNFSAQIKDLLAANSALKEYSSSLESLVGIRFAKTRDVLPKWYEHGENIPGAENFQLHLLEIDRKNGNRNTELCLFVKEPSDVYKEIFKIGNIEYSGIFSPPD